MDSDELPKDKNPGQTATRWIKRIREALDSKEYKAYVREGKKIVATYRNKTGLEEVQSAKTSPSRVTYNVLWSNVQVLKPTLFSRVPKPAVERRFSDSDPVGRMGAQIVQRALLSALLCQQDRFKYAVGSAVENRLLPGMGQVWLRYDAEFECECDEQGEPLLDDEGNERQVIKPFSERVVADPIYWQDFLMAPARNVFESDWRAKRAYMSREDGIERFGEIFKDVPIAKSPDTDKDNEIDKIHADQAEVWEIWDRKTKTIFWICLDYDKSPLDVKPDKLHIEDFFSCPDPLCATTTTDSLIPVPDYKIYQKLAEEYNFVCDRLSAMVECVRLVGATAKAFNAEIKSMLSLRDGQLWPIEGWNNFVEKGGLAGNIDWLPFDQCVAAIGPLMQYKDDLLNEINSITGIPDIALGAADPTETLGSQQLKSRWTVVKISDKQEDVQRFCRQALSIMAQIIFEPGLFSDETIALMAGVAQMPQDDQALFPQGLQLVRDDRLRTFRIDIETDSTIATDEEEDKQSRMEYIQAVNSLMANLQSVSQFRPELIHPMIESAKFAARAFRTGKGLEAPWEKALQQIEDNDAAQAEAAQNQPPPPDVELMKAQNEAANIAYKNQDLQRQMMNAGVEEQARVRREQFDEWLDTQKLDLAFSQAQNEFDLKSQQLEIEAAKVGNKDLIDQTALNIEKFKQSFEASIKNQRLELDKYKTVLEEKEKLIEEARLKQQQMDTQLSEISKMSAAPQPPAIHIHNGGAKEIVMRRAPDGTLIGSTREIEGSA